MARYDDPNSATSQFFINLKDNSHLDPSGGGFGYAVFGKVIEGMDVVEKKIAKTKNRKQGPVCEHTAADNCRQICEGRVKLGLFPQRRGRRCLIPTSRFSKTSPSRQSDYVIGLATGNRREEPV